VFENTHKGNYKEALPKLNYKAKKREKNTIRNKKAIDSKRH
jgi:hypothetical protein